MSTSSLASIKKNFGISDDLPIEYEKKGDELIIHIPLRQTKQKNKEIRRSVDKHEIPNETTLNSFTEDKSAMPVFHSIEELRKDLLS